VSVVLQPEFPSGYLTNLNKELVYPSPGAAVLKRGLGVGDVVEVLPGELSTLRPSHVDIAVSNFGIKRQVLGTGILRFDSDGRAEAILRFPIELDNAPKIEQITKLKDTRKPARPLYEITFLNPSSEQINISWLKVRRIFWNGGACMESGANRPHFSFKVQVYGNRVVGRLSQERPQKDSVSYQVKGFYIAYCEGQTIEFEGPFNYPIEAHERLYLRLSFVGGIGNLSHFEQILFRATQDIEFAFNNSLALSLPLPFSAATPP